MGLVGEVFAWVGFVPALSGSRLLRTGIPLAALAIAATAGAQLLAGPSYSNDRPAPLNVLLHEDRSGGTKRWLAAGDTSAIRSELAQALTLEGGRAPRRFESAVAGTSTVGGAHLPADRFPSVPAPEIEWLTSEATPDGWHLVVRVRSRRAADILGIAFDAELLSARANTAEVPTIREGRMRRSRGLVLLRWESVSAEAVLFDLRLAGAPPPMLTVYDQSHALPL